MKFFIRSWPRQNGKNTMMRDGIDEIMDMREPGESFCSDCPDHEGCMSGYPCSLVKRVEREYQERKKNNEI